MLGAGSVGAKFPESFLAFSFAVEMKLLDLTRQSELADSCDCKH